MNEEIINKSNEVNEFIKSGRKALGNPDYTFVQIVNKITQLLKEREELKKRIANYVK